MSSKILNNVRLIQKCIIVDKDGLILALKRAADDHSRGGNWDLPGGGYEEGEDVIEAAKREVGEEVGLDAVSLQPVYFMNKIGVSEGFFQGNIVFGICYVCHVWGGEVVLSDEHTEFRWITPAELLGYDFGADSGFFTAAIKSFTELSKINNHVHIRRISV